MTGVSGSLQGALACLVNGFTRIDHIFICNLIEIKKRS